MKSVFDLSTPMSPKTAISVYEYCRPFMPTPAPVSASEERGKMAQHALRLRDLLSNFDALLLDGFGVLNVGGEAVPEADLMIAEAQDRGVVTMVLTNGASKDKSIASLKYRGLGLDINPSYVVSSRDALLWHLDQTGREISRFGVIDSFADIPSGYDFDCLALSPETPQDWQSCDVIGFLGATDWHEGWQNALKEAIRAGVHIMVANPDVMAPYQSSFRCQSGFWLAKAIYDLGIAPEDAQVSWFGKPYSAIYDLALSRLEDITAKPIIDRRRIAMVGDTLHTDILGGYATGLSSVLMTSHGLFRHGGVEDAINKTGIIPDYITETV